MGAEVYFWFKFGCVSSVRVHLGKQNPGIMKHKLCYNNSAVNNRVTGRGPAHPEEVGEVGHRAAPRQGGGARDGRAAGWGGSGRVGGGRRGEEQHTACLPTADQAGPRVMSPRLFFLPSARWTSPTAATWGGSCGKRTAIQPNDHAESSQMSSESPGPSADSHQPPCHRIVPPGRAKGLPHQQVLHQPRGPRASDAAVTAWESHR